MRDRPTSSETGDESDHATARERSLRRVVEEVARDRQGRQCDEDRQLTRAAMAASERLLTEIWNNPDDAEYDRL